MNLKIGIDVYISHEHSEHQRNGNSEMMKDFFCILFFFVLVNFFFFTVCCTDDDSHPQCMYIRDWEWTN